MRAQDSPASRPVRLLAMSGVMLAAAWPCMVRCQWAQLSNVGSWGSEPMAVG